MPVEVKATDLVRLNLCSEDELSVSVKKTAKRLIKEKRIVSFRAHEGPGTEVFMLSSRPNGDCLFLHPKTRLCMVYELRPDVCRQFPKVGPKIGFCPHKKVNP